MLLFPFTTTVPIARSVVSSVEQAGLLGWIPNNSSTFASLDCRSSNVLVATPDTDKHSLDGVLLLR